MLPMATTVTSPTDIAVELRSVSKTFTQKQRESGGLLHNLLHPQKKIIRALNDVSFTIRKGEIAAYAGPNGAGKSTTMKLLSGMLLPESGEISVLGLSPKDQRIALMRRIGILFGNRTELWWDHPISQSFEWKKVVWNIPDEDYNKSYRLVTELLELEPLLKTYARELSLGQRMRCDLGLMLLHNPELILLDEPTLGLDVVAKRSMIDFLIRLNRERGTTILVTSHDMDDLEEMADRILMVAGGSVMYNGDFDGLRRQVGNLSILRVQSSEERLPQLPGAKLLSHQNGIAEWEVDLSNGSIRQILLHVSNFSGLANMELEKAPIEKAIAQLYRSW